MEVMMEEISAEAAILMSALGTAVTNQKKQQIRMQITEKVNAVGGNARSVEQVRKRWKDLKASVIKKKQETAKTGGGPAPPPLPFEDLVLGVLGANTNLTTGVSGTNECDTWTGASASTTLEGSPGSQDMFVPIAESTAAGESQVFPVGTVFQTLDIAVPTPHILQPASQARSPQPSTSTASRRERPASTPPRVESARGQAKTARRKLLHGAEKDEDCIWDKYVASQVAKNELQMVLMKEALEETKQRREMLPLQKKALELKIQLLEQEVSEVLVSGDMNDVHDPS
ncbi:uncharacterized protein LOC143294948 isoform X1 [Babylonia areolata]|uniref:uncharacterized protein LOC143294948 isoform X1 n=1 Tax=Babylonia areolata TaxID=304850 RepID=UPI003FD2FAA6